MANIRGQAELGGGRVVRLVADGIGYSLPGSEVPLLYDVSFDTEDCSRVGIIGKSGIGKTTLFRILAGLEKDHIGEVRFPGRRREDVCVGYCFQDRRLMPWATLRQNVEWGLPLGTAIEAADDIIERMGLSASAERKARDASGGELARCAIARALLSDPDLLLLDEPMSGLDEPSRRRLLNDLLAIQHASSFLLLLVTHDIAEVTLLCESVKVLRGSPASVTDSFEINGTWTEEDCNRLNTLVAD